MRRLLAALAFLAIASPAAAQEDIFDGTPAGAGAIDTSLSIFTYDATATDPFQRLRRRAIADLIALVPPVNAANIIGAVTGSPSPTSNRIQWAADGTLTWAIDASGSGGSATFLGLTDVAATSIVDGQCVRGNSGGGTHIRGVREHG